MDYVGHYGAQHHADDGEPVDGFGDVHGFVVLLVQEVAQHQNDAHGRQGAVKDVQPSAEVPVQPHGGDGANDA